MRFLLWGAKWADCFVGVYQRFFHREIINFIYSQSQISIKEANLWGGPSASQQYYLLTSFFPHSRIKSIDPFKTKIRNSLVLTQLKKTNPNILVAGYSPRVFGSASLVKAPSWHSPHADS